jgi:hypothetical protein
MIRRMFRPLLIALVVTLAAGGLAACGKKGSPQPPGDSDFPRVYPNLSKYPQPDQPAGSSRRDVPPEQGTTPYTTEDNEDDLGFNPGRMSR